MWLLDTRTLKLRHFITDIPDYVILSHTWGNDEVGFHDIAQPYAKDMAGFSKISRCCAQAVQAGFEWVWIDTCCIDKRSSAELSEAINSMYRWYWNAAICYVFFSDLAGGDSYLQSSRWFNRGWTLQELLAPETIEFYNSDWRFLGTKTSLVEGIFAATRINKQCLLDRTAIKNTSIAAKFSWASGRVTTREEDMAYCLLGLVQVNMPMLYGEGRDAFYRLQLEIIKQNTDHTIFAWAPMHLPFGSLGFFASSPAHFANAAGFRPNARQKRQPATYEMTNHGLSITIPCIRRRAGIIALLDCSDSDGMRLGVDLRPTGTSTYRRLNAPLTKVDRVEAKQATTKTIYIETRGRGLGEQSGNCNAMTVHNMSEPSRVRRIATGDFMGIDPDQVDGFCVRHDPDLRRNDFISTLADQVVHDGEFISFIFRLDDDVGYSFFLGLYGGRPWIHASAASLLPLRVPYLWLEEVDEERKLFEAGTGDQHIPGQENHFTDYLSFPIEGYRMLEALARKTRSEGSVQWNVNISVKNARKQEL